MEVQACGDCGVSVSTTDIEEAGAGSVKGVFFCANCYAKLRAAAQRPAANAPLELIRDDNPAAKRQAPPVSRASSRRAKSASGRNKRISGQNPVVRSQSSRASSASRQMKKVSSGRVQAQKSASSRIQRVAQKPPQSSSGRLRAQAGQPTPSGRMQTASGRFQTESGRFQSQSGRYESAPKKSGGMVIVILILIIIGILGAIVFVMLNKDKNTGKPKDDQTAAKGDKTQDDKDTPKDDKKTDPDKDGAKDPDKTDDKKDDPKADPEKVKKEIEDKITEIQNKSDAEEFHAAYILAEEAKEDYKDNEDILNAFDEAEMKLKNFCKAEMEDADDLLKAKKYSEAKAKYSDIADLEFDPYSELAENKKTEIAKIQDQQDASSGKEEAAKKAFQNCAVFFNDVMDDLKDARKTGMDKKTAVKFDELLQIHGTTEFIKTKKKFIEAVLRILNGEVSVP